MDRAEQCEVMDAFSKALSREIHNLTTTDLCGRPQVVFQQLYNRLQWVDSDEANAPVSRAISRRAPSAPLVTGCAAATTVAPCTYSS